MPASALTLESVREQLAAEPADSDAAVILSAALADAERAGPDQQADIIGRALQQADEARKFSPHLEAPLPEGWPRPSLPGLVRVKSYPSARQAVVTGPGGNGRQAFWVLYHHIKDRQVPLTGPVVVGYPDQPTEELTVPPDSMAFLYSRADLDTTGEFGPVHVQDAKPLQVVSIGLTGAYRKASVQSAVAQLHGWLKANPQWQPSGPVRVLGYNSPFTPASRKYSEVQIPVRAAPAAIAAAGPGLGQR
jgi:hypothetical protein